jgi:hypothetical protein
METVKLPEPAEFGPEDQKIFENTKHWFRIDFVPKMSRVLRMLPAAGDGLMGRSGRRAPRRGAGRSRRGPCPSRW